MRVNGPNRRIPAAVCLIGLAAIWTGGARADQVFPDDVIVQGSVCAGFDCVLDENFGFATIRLKENNTRLDFVDTSAPGSFPTRDWRIQANESGSGAANNFAIKDLGDDGSTGGEGGTALFTLSAGAPANSIFVNSSGRLGLRTAAPVLDIHVRTGNTPATRLEQDGSGGFTPQTWDIGANEANFFVRDVTGGSKLPFRIRPGAPTSSVDIAASGNVGVNTTAPQTKLHVGPPGSFRLEHDTDKSFDILVDADNRLRFVNQGQNRLVIDSTGKIGIGVDPIARLHTVGTVRFNGVRGCSAGIRSSSNGTLSCMTSSRRFKTITGELAPDVALANVMALRPQVGVYNESPEIPEHWLIAEDVAQVDPAFVGLQDGQPFTVKTQNIVADLIAVVQQQQRRIEELERRISQQP